MRRALTSLAVLAMTLPFAVAAGEGGAAIDCGSLDGYEYLTEDGLNYDFAAPRFAFPEMGATRAETGRAVTHYRSANHYFTLNVAPATGAALTIDLSWEGENSDFDIFVFDEDGFEIGRSDTINVADGVHTEQVWGLPIQHCQNFEVVFASYAGDPTTTLHAAITVEPDATLLACGEDDTARNCAGKAAGEAPDPLVDASTTYYLGGDRPGQAAMAYDYVETTAAGSDYPLQSALVDERPTSGDPNFFARVIFGFNTERNPLVPFWSRDFEEPIDLDGDASALVWLSSATMDKNEIGTLMVDLYIDTAETFGPYRIEIPGDQLGPDARPFLLRFPDVKADNASRVTLQIATDPWVSTSGEGKPEDANHTVYYDSVQFQSRLILPTV